MEGEEPMRTNPQPVDYKTHILIGVRANGMMTVIAVTARDGYVTFVLCTPTAIIPAGGHGDAAGHQSFGSSRR